MPLTPTSQVLPSLEIGGGLGHMGPLRALGAEFVRRGTTVAIATVPTHLELCRQAFAGSGVEVLAATALPQSSQQPFPAAATYAAVLHDCGYSSAENLTATAGEWLDLFDVFFSKTAYYPHIVVPFVSSWF